ncbi:MAG: BGTF surface domain-containing protein, partial [Haloarculaceae archaeon]
QDAENDTYYVAIDVGDASFGRMNDDGDVVGSSASVASGNKFNTSFTVADDRLLGDADATESVYANVEFVAPSVSLDSTPVSVKPASGQKISGTSTYAPGTTFTVRVRSTGDTQPRFFKPAEVTVGADGTWTATFDFSGQAAGDTFQVTTTKGDVKADGSVSESTPTPSPTPSATPSPTATAPPSASPEPTDSPTASPTPSNGGGETPTPSPTETTTPGFGAAIAIVALL